jgi:hypothetical protein
MASIYERPPFYKGEKKWDDNDTLSEVYKLRSKNPKNKNLVENHKDNGGYSIKFTVNKTIPKFNQGAEKCELTWVDSFKEFKNVLQGQHRTAWKQTLHKNFPEPVDATRPVPSKQDRNSEENFRRAISLFLQRTLNEKKPRDRQYIYLQPGGDHIFQKAMMTKPIDHLRMFEEMLCSAEALPAGDMPTPNDALKIEWFYMSFHLEDRNRYLKSGQRLCDETLMTVAEYFDNIYNSQMADGSLMKKQEKQIKFRAKRELRHKMAKSYNDKIHHFGNKRYGHDDRRHKRGHLHCQAFDKSRPYKRNNRDKNRSFRRDDRTHKAPPKHKDKAFEGQPCHIHGPKSQHSYDKCYKNPRNQDKYFPDKKRNHEAHHNDEQETIDDKESRASMDSPSAIDSPVLHPEDKEQGEEEQYHVQFDRNVKGGARMARHVPPKRKSAKATVSTTLKRKFHTFLDDNLDIGLDFGNNPNDSVLMGLDSLIAAANADDITNPFDFK